MAMISRARQVQDKMEEAQKEQFLNWQAHPVTEMVMEWARSKRESLKEDWANGMFTAANDFEMLIKNAAATSACSILDDLLNISYVELGESKNGE